MVEPRKSSLRKAPAVDVLDAITGAGVADHPQAPAPAVEPAKSTQSAKKAAGASGRKSQAASRDDSVTPLTPRRIGPGRPRGRRRMEPFSTKIEISLRDEVDEFLVANEMTMVDFVDEAFRMRLKR